MYRYNNGGWIQCWNNFFTISLHQHLENYTINWYMCIWWLCCFSCLFSNAINGQFCLVACPDTNVCFWLNCCIWSTILSSLNILILWLLIVWYDLGEFLLKQHLSLPFRFTLIKPSIEWIIHHICNKKIKPLNQSLVTKRKQFPLNLVFIIETQYYSSKGIILMILNSSCLAWQ